ncbi:MAG: hypothetical protein KA100_00945 [Rickettsiales bacterium]|nr:hypothetical protein [Rickettsiales bacterium]
MSKPSETRKNLLITICLKNWQLSKQQGYFAFDKEGNFKEIKAEQNQALIEERRQFHQKELEDFSEEIILNITAKIAYGRLCYLDELRTRESFSRDEAKEILFWMKDRFKENLLTSTDDIAEKYREIRDRAFEKLNLPKDASEESEEWLKQAISDSEFIAFFQEPSNSPANPTTSRKRSRSESESQQERT